MIFVCHVAGLVTSGVGGVASGSELRERHRTGNGRGGVSRGGDDDTKSVENISTRGVRHSLLDLVSSKVLGRHTPTHHYYHQQQQQVSSVRNTPPFHFIITFLARYSTANLQNIRIKFTFRNNQYNLMTKRTYFSRFQYYPRYSRRD